jgi:hypothetical protein
MEKPFLGPEETFRMVGRTTNLQEANLLAEQYEMRGFDTKIIRKKQGGISLYEVWAGKKPDIFHSGERLIR